VNAIANQPAISVRHLSKCYQIYNRPQDRLKQAILPRLSRAIPGRTVPVFYREFWALRDVSLDVAPGEAVGIIGRNGAGKSTLLQIIAGTLTPTGGEVQVFGRVAALLELGSGFNPDFTGRENVYLSASLLGMSSQQIDAKFDEIAAFADIDEFIEQPVKTYSSGMVVRLAFSVQAVLEPDILIVDEALAVGDAKFQKKCYERLDRFRNRGGTILFVTHDIGAIVQLCSRAIALERGEIMSDGDPRLVSREYHALLFGIPAQPAPSDKVNDWKAGSSAQSRPETGVSLAASKEVRHGSRLVEIVSIGIQDENGAETRVVETSQPATFYYRVRFNVDIEDTVSFGFLVSSSKGLEIYGTKSGQWNQSLPSGRAGEEFECRLSMNVLLVPGAYLLTVAIAPSDDSRSDFYDCRFDALEFKVIGNPPCFLTGVVDVPAQLTHQRVANASVT
jgi:lipopolysaccharide transport system ATP-binding protein